MRFTPPSWDKVYSSPSGPSANDVKTLPFSEMVNLWRSSAPTAWIGPVISPTISAPRNWGIFVPWWTYRAMMAIQPGCGD